MITEDYVSFETARLLKEKGFNEKVICYYDDGGSLNLNKFVEFQCCNQGYGSGVFAAPTLQMATKWLREVHGLYIENSLSCERKDKNAKIFDAFIFNIQNQRYKKLGNIQDYEKACETAIKYCLENLI